jgi:hypothetical protein
LLVRIAVNNRKQGKIKRCSSLAVTWLLLILLLILFDEFNRKECEQKKSVFEKKSNQHTQNCGYF